MDEYGESGSGSDWEVKRAQIGTHQEHSLKARRVLMTKTKEFRKLPDESKAKEAMALVRSYQEEIDELSRRAKYAEAVFLEVSKSLGSQLERDSELKRLQMELGEYEKEFSTLKNQEVVIRNLEEKLKRSELEMEQLKEGKSKELDRGIELALVHQERAFQVEKEKSVKECDRLRSLLDESQREMMSLRTALESIDTGKDDVVRLLTDDLSASRREVMESREEVRRLQGRNGLLERERQELSSGRDEQATIGLDAHRERLENLEKELDSARNEVILEKKVHEETKKTLLSEKEIIQSELLGRKEELSHRPTLEQWEALKQRLRIIESLEFNAHDGEEAPLSLGWGDDADVEVDENALLHRKKQKLETENIKLREELGKLVEKFDASSAQVTSLNEELKNTKELVISLEEDLEAVGSAPSAPSAPSDGLAGAPFSPGLLHSFVGSSSSHEGTLESASPPLSSTTSTYQVPPTPAPSHEDGAMLHIVSGQRDRLKRRVLALEDENHHMKDTVERLQRDLGILQTDNVKLYEQMKYVESYGKRRHRMQDGADGGGIEDIEAKYQRIYEGQLDPFREFTEREKEERLRALNPADRITLSATRVLTGSKYMRMFLFAYSILLHLLVAFVLYYCGGSTAPHDPNAPIDPQEMQGGAQLPPSDGK
jgi:homeobox protein cut-like